MMWALRLVFCILTALGLLASVAAHVSTFFDVNPQAVFPPLVWLHLGIFLVCLPAFLLANRPRRHGEEQRDELWQDSPRWMIGLALGLFAYALVNFALFIRRVEGTASLRPDGTYYLHRSGRFIRDITEEDYHWQESRKWRMASGHWMLFYSWALTAILPRVWTRIARSDEGSPQSVGKEVRGAV